MRNIFSSGRLSVICFLSFVILMSAGCSKSLRYSPDEIKDFPPSVQEKIQRGEVAAGMTQNQVRLSWGGPQTVNILPPSESGKPKEEWIYSRIGVFKTRLIFTDGKLTEIITAEPWIVK